MSRTAVARACMLALIGACASWAAAQTAAPERCDNCGTVLDVRQTASKSTWTPLGTVVPGTMGGDHGQQPGRVTAQYQIGPALRNQGMVLLGSAGGGGYARRPEDVMQTRWAVAVKMDRGDERTVSIGYEPPFRGGDRVRVFGTQLELIQP
ncbi:MAG: hypothetical protein ABI585_04215 [Betaproteobacteria bacterium]